MNQSDIDKVSASAVSKYECLTKSPFTYMMRAIMAGFFIIVAVILSNVSAAVLYPTFPQFGKILGSILFPTAIILIVFIGGELFTGNNMTMALGFYEKKVSAKGMIAVWAMSYIGNFIGAFILGYIYVKSGSSIPVLTEYLNAIVMPQLTITPVEMILRGMLCNFMVCLAVYTNSKMQTESGKLVIMFMVIMAFVVAGFEHSIANMGLYSIAAFLVDGMTFSLVMKSMLFVTIGNILGGAVLLALPLKLMVLKEK